MFPGSYDPLLIASSALPSKPLNSIALYDADAASALSFVKKKLKDAGIDQEFTQEQTTYVERLGGRASDLESVRLSSYFCLANLSFKIFHCS